MPKRPVVFPYNPGSQSARALANALGTIRVRENGRYRIRPNDLVINWGNSERPRWMPIATEQVLNKPVFVASAINKRMTFLLLEGHEVPIPDWTDAYPLARQKFTDRQLVVGRATISGHSGRGITIGTVANLPQNLPLYVEYIKKKKEFRVHVFNGQVIDVQEKRKMRNFDGEINTQIRSHANGWVFCRDNIVEPRNLRDIAVRAVAACDLYFGAVDIIWNERTDSCYVLEINTAPGLEGTTLINYVNAIRRVLN